MAGTSALVRRNVECASQDFWLGNFDAGPSGLRECEAACARRPACRYFVFGHGSEKAGHCYHEASANSTCPQGYEADEYDFYELLRWQPISAWGVESRLVAGDVECLSPDRELGYFPGRLDECAAACAREPACSFFIFGEGPKAGACYMEFTSQAACPDGFEVDSFDFYELVEPGRGAASHAGGLGGGTFALAALAALAAWAWLFRSGAGRRWQLSLRWQPVGPDDAQGGLQGRVQPAAPEVAML